jgi:3-deoxy-D-manno-octulosonate 8-phosphate phosphatase (KDO 8-P phosphatase)
MTMLNQFKQITAFVFAIDGVLTNNRILLTEKGDALEQLTIKDEYALGQAVKKEYPVIFMSSNSPTGVRIRLTRTGISQIFLDVVDKLELTERLIRQNEMDWKQILVMGYDLPDLSIMKMAGLSCSPADAPSEIKQVAHYISPYQGGEGCIRDVIEKVMKLNGHWEF